MAASRATFQLPGQPSARHLFSVAVEKQDVDVSSLDQEQRNVFDKALAGQSLFVTGGAGRGKSFLLKVVIEGLRQKLGHTYMVAVTASTGMASSRIGGSTIHSWAGLTGSEKSVPDALKRIKSGPQASLRWVETQVLVSDEVSMLGADEFDMMEAVARNIRGNDYPFGGIQLLWTGDFLQLPPVTTLGQPPKFAFQATSWGRVFQEYALLSSVYRQSDPEFIHALDCCRTATLDDKTVALLSLLSRPIASDFLPHCDPIYLFPTRKEVDTFNKQRLSSIPSPPVTFKSHDWIINKKMTSLFDTIPVASSIDLTIGTQVMLVRNLDDGLNNGTIGIVRGFYTYKQATGDQSYNKKIGFVRNVCVTNDGMPLFHSTASGGPFASMATPLIEFFLQGVSEHVLILPMEFQADLEGRPAVKRTQLPLILAWAITVHKSQGHSFDKVVVDLSRVFARGQAYVALSRARTISGLQVKNFSRSKVLVNPIALQWYRDTFRAL